MDHLEDPSNDAPRFQWGKKRGVGGAKRNFQFYESFMIDNIIYSLYDSIYAYNEIGEPHIGKIVKLWQQPDNKRKVKLVWFFRPNDLYNYLEDKPLEKEIFLATGEGVGLCNINPLEVILGKCSVICTLRDERNPQPSNYELETADYIFYRTFNVQSFTISENFDEKIAGVEVKYFLNRKEDQSDFKTEVKADTDKVGPLIPIPPSTSMPDPLRTVENTENNNIKSAATSFKKAADIVSKLSGQCLSDKRGSPKMEITSEGGNVEDDSVYDKNISHSGLVDGKYLKKMKNPVQVMNATHLNMHEVESNGCNSSSHQESSEMRSDAPVDKILKRMVTNASKEAMRHPSFQKPNMESNGVGSSKEILHLNKKLSENRNLVDGKTKIVDGPEKKTPLLAMTKKHSDNEVLQVTRRPDVDRSKWFKMNWEERMRKAEREGTLVLVENLDPSYASSEVEDIIFTTLQLSCNAKMIPQATFQNPNHGQAYVIFKTRDAADSAVSKINRGCILLPNGSPLLCSKGLLEVPKSSIRGHLSVNKLLTRETRMAVSTSHCSQPNTIEYEMAMEWRLCDELAGRSLKILHKEQADKLKEVKRRLKSK
ncbi:protein ANTI-SILENCING 1 [Curcuma longa]|uniref:protein ANTI-SILENCING 1 n=1 Tax=Curcuma longa TaxID=136217 RepID=UPI003D9F568C